MMSAGVSILALTWQVKPALATALSEYMATSPEPASRNIHTATDIRRGAMYYYSSAGGEEVRASIIGISSLSDCPSISGLNSAYAVLAANDGRVCRYKLPDHTG